MGLATNLPISTHNVTPKVRVISLAPWRVGSSRFVLFRAQGPLFKMTTTVGNRPSFLGLSIVVRVVNLGQISVLNPPELKDAGELGNTGSLWGLYSRRMYLVGTSAPSYGPGERSFLDFSCLGKFGLKEPTLGPLTRLGTMAGP